MTKILLGLLVMLSLVAMSACTSKPQASGSETSNDNPTAAQAQLRIEATNYTFDQAAYHIKAGVPVEIILDSTEGNHGVHIQGLDVHLDNKHNSAVITPDKAGTYDIACSIPCGPGHRAMKAKLIVE
jgi:cytochrome c oxidase subunit II